MTLMASRGKVRPLGGQPTSIAGSGALNPKPECIGRAKVGAANPQGVRCDMQ